METIKIVDKGNHFIVIIGQVYLASSNALSPHLSEAKHYPNHNAADYAVDLWLETTY